MIEANILQTKLDEVREKLREVWRRRMAARLLVVGGLLALGIGLSVPWLGGRARLLAPALVVLLAVASFILRAIAKRKKWSNIEVARLIEKQHPDLDSLVLTAAEQLDLDTDAPGALFRNRILAEASARGAVQSWAGSVTGRSMNRATWQMLLATAACLAASLWMLSELPLPWKKQAKTDPEVAAEKTASPTAAEAAAVEWSVTPGDVEVERGGRLVVEAAAKPALPEEAVLVMKDAQGKELARNPMRVGVDAATFGGLLTNIKADALYQVEGGGSVSKSFKITTFEYPALVRCDVKVTPPAYTGQPAKEVKNTLKVTAIEGSDIAFTIKINKPVKDAELFGEDKTALPLKPLPGDATVLTANLLAEKSQKWRLHLVDEKERANKNPPWIQVTVQSNQLAKIEVLFPKRDVQVSAIQELPVEARVSDDLGVTQSGASYTIGGRTKEILFKSGQTESARKQEVKALLSLEQEGAEPRQLLSYYFWAEDKGPKGEVRRSMSDMFFADVRHFEDIFREAEAPPSSPGKSQPKGQTDELVDLQKQVVNATWKLIRDTNGGRTMDSAAADADVVRQGQQAALDKTKEGMEKTEDAEIKNALTEAWKSMKDALAPLNKAATDKERTALNQALGFEQSALEWLHRAQSREHRVMRQNSRSQSSSGSQQAMKNQLMDLELKQKEQRYEEEKQASEEQSAEQQENLQVLNRLKELARRQEALAEKMKELKKQLEQAKTEEQKQELENQLQRLQQEQEQLLRDVDELKDRMEKPENSSTMAEAKQQLDQTRDKVMEAAEQLKEQRLTEAANAATRAQRELEKMQEDFKQKTAKRFADEMKQLRDKARDVAERQKQISDALENQKTPEESLPGDTSSSLEKMLKGSELARQVEEQSTKVDGLLEEMRRVSEQAEGNNPLLHRSLYEAVRQAQTSALQENLQETRDQARHGNRADAQEAERKATAAVEQLQKGVEKAAESVLGSETEALRMARSELDQLIKEVERQAEGAQGTPPPQPGRPNPPAPQPGTPEAADQTRPKNLAEHASPPPGTSPESPAPPKEAKPNAQAEDPEKAGEVAQGNPMPAPSQTNPPEADPESKAKEGPKTASSSQRETTEDTKGGGYRPGDDPGNPGKSKDKFATFGLAPKPGERGGTGMDQNKPSEGGAPQPAGEGLPKDAPVPQMAGQQPLESGTGQFPQPPPGPQVPPAGASQNPSSSAELAQNPGGRPGEAQDTPPGAPKGPRPQQPQEGKPGSNSSQPGLARGGERRGTGSDGGDMGGLFFDEAGEVEQRGPFTTDGYEDWSDRLRNVEELLTRPELRNDVARVLDNARALRVDLGRSNQAPQVEHLRTRITQPLIELRDRVVEELARKDTGNPMVPVDRDPVPPAYRDLVRRYYTELGAGK